MGGGPAHRPVIAIAGLACETSTFSPSKTLAPAFHPKRGEEVIQKYAFLHPGTPLSSVAEWKGALIGHALPGGIVTRDAFEELADEIVSRLQEIVVASPALDGLWFDIHGAMCVEGLDDVEAELLRRVREVIGRGVVVSASMDLHGNVSRELAHQCDLITCYRMAPHEDTMETKERACRNLVELLAQNERRPLKAWVPVPILLPGEQTSTRVEPAKHIYAAVPEIEAMEGVIDAAIWVGYAWADEPRNRGAVVVTGWNEKAVVEGAEKLAKLFWDAHKKFVFVAPHGSFKECLDTALASKSHPYFISDSGDNPTAGGSGDMTWGLTKLLARPEFKDPSGPTVIYASVPGPHAVRTAVEAGVGAIITVTAGAEVDNIHAGPLTMTGRVHSIKQGDKDAVIEVVLQVGSVFAILTELRKPYHHEADFTDLNLVPRSADIVIVKIGYLEPELYNMAKDWMLALTPGGVDQDLERLGHHRIRRPMWPFDKTFEKTPNLSARIIPMSNAPLTGLDE
jgi:microcystin degradation protein MlrC